VVNRFSTQTFAFFLFLSTSLNCQLVNSQDKKVAAKNTGITVVELFTSEGCSSCPSADALAERISGEDSNVFVLAYHVDYWDRLGWKDPFSQLAFSQRQRTYAQQFALESVYTPQVIINGQKEFVGSNEARLRYAIATKLSKNNLMIEAKRDGRQVNISYSLSNRPTGDLCFAFIQPNTTTKVLKGENGGRQLDHVNVARFLKTIQAKQSANLDITLPPDLDDTKLNLVVFLQSKNMEITAAAKSIL